MDDTTRTAVDAIPPWTIKTFPVQLREENALAATIRGCARLNRKPRIGAASLQQYPAAMFVLTHMVTEHAKERGR